MIFTATYSIDAIERRKLEFGAPVETGHDVWIGGNVSILPGVTAGDGCAIGAGSVVNKSIPVVSVRQGILAELLGA